jgi:hypothetical protein
LKKAVIFTTLVAAVFAFADNHVEMPADEPIIAEEEMVVETEGNATEVEVIEEAVEAEVPSVSE